jgi:hypothetical protein
VSVLHGDGIIGHKRGASPGGGLNQLNDQQADPREGQ